ncbi:MAG: Ig-like domain-containing protein, partial [Solirubrobacteraceae bacterium]
VFVLPARPRIALIAIGALVGAALLCKVNVGGYAAIAVGYAAVMSLPRMPWGRILRVAAIAAIVLVGPTVMTPTLNTGWTQRYAFLVAASAVGLVLATARSNGLGETAGADAQHWIVWLLSGLAGALALVIGVIFALGTTPRALYESVIVAASHQASVFAFPLPLTAVVLGWATAAVGLAWIVRRRPSVLVGHRRLGAVLRVLVGLVILCSVVGAFPLNIEPENARFALALPLAWVAALPSTRDDGSLAGRFVRLVIPALAVMQALIAYPVSGTQMPFGSVLLLICGAVCVADGWSDLETSARDQPVRHRQAAPWAIMTSLTTALAIVFTVQYVVRPARSARLIYNSEQPLPFPGSRRLHLPRQQVAVFTSVVSTLRGRCRSVLTMPGMMSLNLWSALPAPSGMTQEPWWAVLSPAQLRVALARARAARGLCLVRDNVLVGFWLQGRELPQIPLVRFVTDDFSQLAQYGTYVISAPITAGSPPDIISVGPPNGASEVSPQTRVYAIFNRTMNRAATATSFSLVRTSDAQPVAGRIMFLVDNLPVLLPSKPLVPETRYTATISAAATDKVGNHLRVAKQWSFTTARP